ncbi:MAG: hypothetical protein ACXV9T_16565 [Methylobacter sp.]
MISSNFLNNANAPTPACANATEAFLTAIAGGLSEDFPDDISDTDLSTDAHRETLE